MVCNPEDLDTPLKGTPLDYSNKDNWLRFGCTSADKEQDVDVFYLYPTCADPKLQEDVAVVDDYMRKKSLQMYRSGPCAFEPFANVYAPFYRQLSFKGLAPVSTGEKLLDAIRNEVVRTDAFAAIDYYFENCNEGRPFILAAHSQGAATMRIVLSEYMRMPEHREYMERMIAAYVPGYHFPAQWLKENGMKAAEGETDTGVLITWNTFTEWGDPIFARKDCVGINPINWAVDPTPADSSQHLGMKQIDPETSAEEIILGEIAAVLDPDYQCVVRIKIDTERFPPLPDNQTYGTGSYHPVDWSLFYSDIGENARKRVDAYLKKNRS